MVGGYFGGGGGFGGLGAGLDGGGGGGGSSFSTGTILFNGQGVWTGNGQIVISNYLPQPTQRPTAFPNSLMPIRITSNVPTPSPSFMYSNFSVIYTGTYSVYVVPYDLYWLNVLSFGAQGGSFAGNNGGLGGFISASIDVTPGQTLYLYVGSSCGGDFPSCSGGGYNGGGDGENYVFSGGGGASDVRTIVSDLNSRLVIAGGGVCFCII